jgi:hypothetical protein
VYLGAVGGAAGTISVPTSAGSKGFRIYYIQVSCGVFYALTLYTGKRQVYRRRHYWHIPLLACSDCSEVILYLTPASPTDYRLQQALY